MEYQQQFIGARRARWLVAIAVLALAPGASAAHFERIVFRAGPTVTPNDPGDAGAVDLAIGIEPDRPSGWLRVVGDRVQFELSGGWLLNADPPDGEVAVGRAGILWRYYPDFLPEHRFIEIGPGVAYRSSRYVNGIDQGSRAQFSIQATLGIHFGPDRRRRLALRWQHTSNAGTATPNPGINALLVELGYRWGDAPPVGPPVAGR